MAMLTNHNEIYYNENIKVELMEFNTMKGKFIKKKYLIIFIIDIIRINIIF